MHVNLICDPSEVNTCVRQKLNIMHGYVGVLLRDKGEYKLKRGKIFVSSSYS